MQIRAATSTYQGVHCRHDALITLIDLEQTPLTRVIVRWSYPSPGRLISAHVCLQCVYMQTGADRGTGSEGTAVTAMPFLNSFDVEHADMAGTCMNNVSNSPQISLQQSFRVCSFLYLNSHVQRRMLIVCPALQNNSVSFSSTNISTFLHQNRFTWRKTTWDYALKRE